VSGEHISLTPTASCDVTNRANDVSLFFRRLVLIVAAIIGLTALTGCDADWRHIPPTRPTDQSKYGP
jgi:hypothetical protein